MLKRRNVSGKDRKEKFLNQMKEGRAMGKTLERETGEEEIGKVLKWRNVSSWENE